MSYIIQLNSPPASGQRKTLHSLADTTRFLREQFQLEACYDAEGNFICFAPPELDGAAQTAERLPENGQDEDTAVFYSHNEQAGGSLWMKNPTETQLELLLNIMLALDDGSYVSGDDGESYRVKKGAIVYIEPPETPSGWRDKARQFWYSYGVSIVVAALMLLLQIILNRLGWR